MVNDMPITLWGKLVLRYDLFRFWLRSVSEKVCIWLAWRMPRQLVLWAAVRLMSHATCTKFSNRTPDNVSIMDALDAWEKD